MIESIFKAYDVRGKYPEELNEETALNISAAVGKHFKRATKIVIGYDARLSSPSLYKAVIKGLMNNELGMRNEELRSKNKKRKSIIHNSKFIIHKAGMVTTPMLYFLVNKLKAGGGIMVTASHNPKEYNGLKVVGKNARPISGKEIYELVKKYRGSAFLSYGNSGGAKSLVSAAGGLLAPRRRSRLLQEQADSGAGRQRGRSEISLYVNFLKKFLRPKRKLKVVFDCSNGTTGLVLKQLLNNELGIRNKEINAIIHNSKFIILNSKPDGNFLAHGPNPLAKGAARQLEKEVKKQKADLGVIFDADGDRVFFVDNRGRWIDPNESAYILTQLFKPAYVVGIVSSQRLKKLNAKGQMSKVYVSRVGHYFFKKLMREKKASLGLEHSGHYYFKDFFYCDSGIFAAIQVINFVSALKGDLTAWLDELPKYYRSGEINFKVEDKEKVLKAIEKNYKNLAVKVFKLDGLTMEFSKYWFNVRPSNTENLLRLNIEAVSKKILGDKLKEIKKLIK